MKPISHMSKEKFSKFMQKPEFKYMKPDFSICTSGRLYVNHQELNIVFGT